MKRRRFLKVSASLGTISTAALAGCTAALSGADPELARERMTSARETLLRNEETFDNLLQQVERGEPPTTFDVTNIDSRVSRAEEALDKAEEVATEDQIATIGAMRKWGDFQSQRAQYIDVYVRLLNKTNTLSAYSETEQYEKAQDAIDELRELLSDLQSELDESESVYNEIDRDALEEGGLVAYHEDITRWQEESENRIELVGLYLDAMEPMLDGVLAYLDGADAFQARNLQSAQERFGDAQVDFAEAERMFQRLQDRDVEFHSIEADLVRLVCITGALSDSSGHMRDAIRAYQNGNNYQANQYAQQASQAADRCGSFNG